MNLSEKILNIIALRSQELYFLLQFVRDFDACILHYYRQTRDIVDMVPDIPSNIKREFAEYAREFGEFLGEVVSEAKEAA